MSGTTYKSASQNKEPTNTQKYHCFQVYDASGHCSNKNTSQLFQELT